MVYKSNVIASPITEIQRKPVQVNHFFQLMGERIMRNEQVYQPQYQIPAQQPMQQVQTH